MVKGTEQARDLFIVSSLSFVFSSQVANGTSLIAAIGNTHNVTMSSHEDET